MDIAKTYDKIAERYVEIYSKNPFYLPILEKFTRLVKSGKILDIGCGAGIPVDDFLVNKRYDVVGIDISERMLNEARKNVPNAKFLKKDILKMDFKPNTFEGICAFFSLLHIKKKDISNVLGRIHQLLKPHGIFVLAVTEGDFEGEGKLLGENNFFSCFLEDEIKGLLHDFEILLIQKEEYNPPEQDPEKHIYLICQKKV